MPLDPIHASPLPLRRPAAHVALEAVDFSWPDGQEVFAGFSLDIKPGEFVAILGPSGCGKTTLLNLLSGFQQPARGKVLLGGVPVRPEMPELGYVFQTPQLFPWLNALENARFGLRMAKQLSEEQQYAKAREYLALVGLAQAAGKLPHQLSGGMQQRVSLARTLALEPSLLLMDEPFAALDAITRNSMNEETLRLWSTLGQTTLFITHDIDEAVFLADRVVVLGMAPQGIARIVDIDLPRPRSMRGTRSLPQFIAYRNDLMEQIALTMQAT